MKEQMESGKYKPSCTSYQSTFFAVEKKGGALWIVHDLQPLNSVMFCDVTLPPQVDDMIEIFSGQAIMSRTSTECLTCHTRLAFVTHFRPISGNIALVNLIITSQHAYNSH